MSPGTGSRRRVVIAPDSFKGTATSAQAAAALAAGWRSVRPDDELVLLPLADGGEGTLDALAAAEPLAVFRTADVAGPDSRPVRARWLLLPDGTAAVELAESSGLPLMREPDALGAHTSGLGEVLAAAVAAGARRIVVGLGGSASTDGGSGCVSALGATFLDAGGNPLPPGGGPLTRLIAVDRSGLLPPPAGGVTCLVDVRAPLLGKDGAATVFGPQKGASANDVAILEAGLERLARVLGGDPERPGAGAAGGTAYGLQAAWGAVFAPGAVTLAELAGVTSALAGADLLITGEGRFDATSLTGKLVGHLLDLADTAGVPTAIVAGAVAGSSGGRAREMSLTELAGSGDAARRDPVRFLHLAGRRLAAGTGHPDR